MKYSKAAVVLVGSVIAFGTGSSAFAAGPAPSGSSGSSGSKNTSGTVEFAGQRVPGTGTSDSQLNGPLDSATRSLIGRKVDFGPTGPAADANRLGQQVMGGGSGPLSGLPLMH